MTTRIAAVTGSNKGIGLAIVRQLALQYPSSPLNTGPLLIYLTARNADRGKSALSALQADEQLQRASSLRAQGGPTEIKYLPLDIDSSDSIREFASYIKKEHPEGIDVLINNAGVALEGFNADVVKKTLHCNYFGTLDATRQLLPHIRQGGRVVNVASMAGHIDQRYAEPIRQRFLRSKSVDDVTGLMKEFVGAVEKNEYEGTWPGAAYKVSKAGVIGMTRALAREEGSQHVLINSCCPGYVITDMTKGKGRKTPDQGAQTPVLLALQDLKGVKGEFWQNEEVKEWAKSG